MNKIFCVFSWAVISILMISVLVVTYWSIYPYKIIEFREGNGTILNTSVKAGEIIKMRQTQCKYKSLYADINRQFVDTLVFQVNPVMTNRPVGCFDVIELVQVPISLPTGKYRIRTTISYHVNPIRHQTYQVLTNEFTVINPADGGKLTTQIDGGETQ